jgi:hypothetical protein
MLSNACEAGQCRDREDEDHDDCEALWGVPWCGHCNLAHKSVENCPWYHYGPTDWEFFNSFCVWCQNYVDWCKCSESCGCSRWREEAEFELKETDTADT